VKDDATIADVAEVALRRLGRAASIDEIFDFIVEKELYVFNTPTPKHVLYTTIQRHLDGGNRTDKFSTIRFYMSEDDTISLQPTGKASGASKSRGPKRIMRASDKEGFIQELMHEQVGIFREIWRLLLFAAQIGVQQRRREVLKATDPGKGIDQSTFGNAGSWPGILYLIGIVDVGDSAILAGTAEGDDQRIQLFQEYANGGLSVLREFFKDRTVDLDGLLAFIQSNQRSENALNPADLELTI
jgi:dnd system-associated protein 4